MKNLIDELDKVQGDSLARQQVRAAFAMNSPQRNAP
jgi:hypothetical protein